MNDWERYFSWIGCAVLRKCFDLRHCFTWCDIIEEESMLPGPPTSLHRSYRPWHKHPWSSLVMSYFGTYKLHFVCVLTRSMSGNNPGTSNIIYYIWYNAATALWGSKRTSRLLTSHLYIRWLASSEMGGVWSPDFPSRCLFSWAVITKSYYLQKFFSALGGQRSNILTKILITPMIETAALPIILTNTRGIDLIQPWDHNAETSW